MNCAHQGPLPRAAVAAVEEALAWKIAPHRLDDEAFRGIPARLRTALGRLISAPAADVILGNSTSYGLHLLANGLRWQQGDEVLLVAGDFPATLLPWQLQQRRGVRLRHLSPRGGTLGVDELEAAITPATRVFCVSWVNPFTGHMIDAHALGNICRRRGVLFVLNASQALGARPLDVATMPVDALSCCGYKWLCGPYATGFCWIRPRVRDALERHREYWLARQAGRTLDRMRDSMGDGASSADVDNADSARALDVFCPADFLDTMPWTAAVEYLLACGIERVVAHDDGLVERLIAGLNPEHYALISPESGPERSTLVVVAHRAPERNQAISRAMRRAGIDIALREGNLRFSPHLYNTDEDIDRALVVLADEAQQGGATE
jgi:cysteine desulfurase/selenocysteine lyase